MTLPILLLIAALIGSHLAGAYLGALLRDEDQYDPAGRPLDWWFGINAIVFVAALGVAVILGTVRVLEAWW